MSIDQELLDILACPKTKERLIYFAEEGFLFSPAGRLKYPIEDDIPILLLEEAEEVTAEEAERLVADARERGLPGA